MRALVAAALGWLALNSSFSNAQVGANFDGEFEIFTRKGSCQAPFPVGISGTAQFRQYAAGDAISFFGRAEAESYFLLSDHFNSNFKKVETMSVRYDFVPIPNDVYIRFTLKHPSNISTDTNEIKLIGEIKGFNSQPECIAVFRALLARWLPN